MAKKETKQEKPFDSFVDHQRKAFEEAARAIDALIPPDFKKHSKNAVSESLEGFRVLVNAAVDEIKSEMDKDDSEGDSKSTTGKGKVKVEVN